MSNAYDEWVGREEAHTQRIDASVAELLDEQAAVKELGLI